MALTLNPFVAQRREMKLRLLDLISKHQNVPQKQIIGLFSLQTGLKKERVLEYWQELEDAGLFEDGRGNSSKGSSEGNSALSKFDRNKSGGADDNNKGNADNRQEPAAERAGSEDHGDEREAGEDDN